MNQEQAVAANVELGLLCRAVYVDSKFKGWAGADKDNPGRTKHFRTLDHRFSWPTDNGNEYLVDKEWLNETNPAQCLKDCQVQLVPGQVYDLVLRGLQDQGGNKTAATASRTLHGTPSNGSKLIAEPVVRRPASNLAPVGVSEKPALAR